VTELTRNKWVKSPTSNKEEAMRMAKPSRTSIALAAALALGVALPAQAQHAGDGFLFHAPQARISIRGGYDHAMAHSDVFDDAVNFLTLNRSDFSGFTLGGEVAFALTSRVDLSLDVGYSGVNKGSEDRHFIDNNNLPIQQSTEFRRVPVTANLRYYLTPPGRNVGRLAWIPNKVTPWVGAGVGMMWYRFQQDGDFVDYQTNNVFPSTVSSSDWTETVQGMGGVDISLTPLVALRGEARYLWARAPLGQDFTGYNRIDLSGVQATLGLSFRL
jgi:opacity protein-like surface antigen